MATWTMGIKFKHLHTVSIQTKSIVEAAEIMYQDRYASTLLSSYFHHSLAVILYVHKRAEEY